MLDVVRDYVQAAPLITIGQLTCLGVIAVAILYGFGLLETIAQWTNARWPKSKRNDKIILPTAWNFNVNKHPVNRRLSADHGQNNLRTIGPIDWEKIERNVRH